ncbi:hypothetical protein KAU33_14695 [Candidatus Dependentiae bacterium]|nr:hypothetical protein [Candidatus Dependentiae bacterium]
MESPNKEVKKLDIVIIVGKVILYGIIISALFLIVFVFIYHYKSYKSHKPVYDLQDCTSNLRYIGIAIEEYSNDNGGHYPQNLKELVEKKYRLGDLSCPITDIEYRYEINGWDDDDFTVWCPNPNKHIGSWGLRSKTKVLYFHGGKDLKQRGVFQIDEERNYQKQKSQQE